MLSARLHTASARETCHSTDSRPRAAARPRLRGPVDVHRKCACGGGCPRCRDETTAIQFRLRVNAPGDAFEQEADRIAERVAEPAPSLQRRSEAPGIATSGAGVSRVLGEPGRPLDQATRSLMEGRIGHDFSQVRVHEGPTAAQSARGLDALAFTVGDHIVLSGRYDPSTSSGRNLLAHELVHTVQQSGAATPSVMRRFNHPDCADEPQGRWIDQITVDQSEPQTVTVHWKNDDGTDGGTEQDACSTGKGHCCVDSTSGASTATCSPTQSRQDGTNCTPIGTKPVIRHVRDHGGVKFWTEIDAARAIALHEYPRVDGTALSHGCVRMNHEMAVKVWCGSVSGRTRVEVKNIARPMCDHPGLQHEWLSDFADAATDPLPPDGDTRKQILETRRELTGAFGTTHTPAQYGAMTAADIPRC